MAEPGPRTWPGDAPDQAVAAALDELTPLGGAVRRAAPLGALTTYRVGGAAAVLVTVGSESDLEVVAAAVGRSGLPVLVVGRGSNLLVADAGFGGIAVQLDPDRFGAISIAGSEGMGGEGMGGEGMGGEGIGGEEAGDDGSGGERAGRAGAAGAAAGGRAGPAAGAAAGGRVPAGSDERREVRAGAAVALPTLARRSVEAGLTGLEWAVGVPGSVGGGVRMNAGGHGSDIAHTLRWCRVVDLAGPAPGATRCLERADLDYGYRRSTIEAHHVVVEAAFDLVPGDPAGGRDAIREIVRWRRENQPGGQNAGSVFTNPGGEPPGNSAGWLIDAAGLKGRRVGTAQVSPKHANFIQADPGGRSGDVLELVHLVQAEVLRTHGVELHPEVKLVGFGSAGPGHMQGSTGG